MDRYGLYILATLVIIMFWILAFKLLCSFLKRKNFTISKRDTVLLIALGVFVIIAFLATFILTQGTFVW
jgi:hypothetical protein